MSSAELANILDDMAARCRSGDSLEGNIEYLLAQPDATHPHQVRAAYRVGNRLGQGGMVLIGQDGSHCRICDGTDGDHQLGCQP